ncbi:10477_t:CDS:2 [Gigaspora margarita]|uniref:10477_t:CDS:1 n=1 Tax=Gigaspora margarita TaxID=4874 RepID=A0ABM8VWM9_GIGMA|nr:10477_t:CDS:2 [Gigaspora margarita]
MVEAQKWLTDNYENKKDNTEEIRINESTEEDIELEGKLTIDGYPNLQKIFLGGTKGITELSINNCPNVEVVFVSDNQITKIEGLANLTKLRKLSFGNNKIEEIDISQNKQLEMLHFAENPKDFKFINGIKELSKLTFVITTLLEQASGEDLKEIAEGLKLNVDGKTPEEMKEAIKNEVAKIEQNKTKLNDKLPGLLDSTATVDDAKLEEIKNNVDKGEKYQKLVDETTNAPIVDADKKEIDQTKLTDQLGKATDYEKLVNDNQDLVTDDGSKKIDQTKIDGLKTSKEKLEGALRNAGIDSNDNNLEKNLAMLKAQNWLDTKYPDKTIGGKIEVYDNMGVIEELIDGELLIDGYVNIEVINLERWDKIKDDELKGEITKVTIKNCPKLKKLKLNNNEISEIIFEGNFPDLVRLDATDNKLTEIDIKYSTKLTTINLDEAPGLDDKLDELKNRPTTDNSDQIKNLLGINPADDLPTN